MEKHQVDWGNLSSRLKTLVRTESQKTDFNIALLFMFTFLLLLILVRTKKNPSSNGKATV